MSQGLNVIIPIGGIGSRFQKVGYRYPKPFINIATRPILFWLISNLSLTKDDSLWIAISNDVAEELAVEGQLKKEFPNLKVNLIPLLFDTCGAAETLYIVCQSMSPTEAARRTISLDCDTIYFDDILAPIRKLPKDASACVYFKDIQDKPIFSYIAMDENDRITDIKEKSAISRNANSGAYVFASGDLLKKHASEVLSKKLPEGFKGEYYTSAVILKMIKEGNLFKGVYIDAKGFNCVGTPDQLNEFLALVRKDSKKWMKPRRFCFDLDGTLVTFPKIEKDYDSCEAIPHNVKLVQELHAAGHHIIIQTARRMKTHSGNVGGVLKDIGPITFRTLERLNIPYDEIFFGKPWAHVYVDDLAVNAMLDTRRELGWLGVTAKKVPRAVIEPTLHNSLEVLTDSIIKSSSQPKILSEIYFYLHVPKDISDLFPKLLKDPEFSENQYSINLEKINGTTFSHLLVNRALTPGRLEVLLQSLKKIHSSDGVYGTPKAIQEPFKTLLSSSTTTSNDIYESYLHHFETTYKSNFSTIYGKLGADLPSLYKQLHDQLKTYVAEKKGRESKVIHGNPTFSNVILKPTGEVSFTSMKTTLENNLKGDALLDLSKIYQSLFGYDHLLLQSDHQLGQFTRVTQAIQPIDQQLLKQYRALFLTVVEREYGISAINSLKLLTTVNVLLTIPNHSQSLFDLLYDLVKHIWNH